ncbi:Tectonin beta-propeller repeat-containing protein 1 [Phytophthora citrophthora]|uniref:Tectonin beta-propeller repeat-containing protein 1 n=1 Tax=Phytophthora citrophthora TaxID=4793 RepID=A0AAD9L9Y7_9STRA|nr:Tectonin beta-propeller repeat-containing protein 1 [Phytophthora citrophthora]
MNTTKEEKMERWRLRLRAFYWAHDPRKVDRVDDILASHKGKEEKFLQQVHRQFGVRDFSGEEAIDDIYEHQRYSYLSFSWGSSFPGHLLPTDRHQWSGLHGAPSSQTREKVEPQLPVNWKWTSDWILDKNSCKCDADGWVYALDFTMINYLIKKGEERFEPNATDYVRRRRWIRTRRRVHNDIPAIVLPEAAADEDVEIRSGDKGSNTVKWVIDGNEEILPEPPSKKDTTVENEGGEPRVANRPVSPIPPKTHVEPAPKIELEQFSMGMGKSAFESAWKSAVRDLENVYARSKEQRSKKKTKWRVKKEKIMRQIHLLEKTIVSMQAVALEEEQKRQQEKARFPGSPRYKKQGTMPSPTCRSTPPAASIDSPTNAINLAARMHCAQSKLDALRRFYWHPRENGYTLRFSIDGIFYGLRDFLVESFTGSYSIQISHQTNGAQGITPTCKVSMKGHTVCCGKHVKVVGEKGTRIPKSVWDSMYMDSDFEAFINLIYVEDVDDPSAVGQGRWEFLLSPEATNVELLNFTRRVKGGMDLPEPMVRKLCSDVLSSLIRDLTLLYFPYELALAFNLPPAKLDIKGEIKITGQPIDEVMEKELKELDLNAIREEQAKQKLQKQITGGEEGGELPVPSSPIQDAASAAAQMFSSLLTGSNKEMQVIAELLQLSPPQFNLLIALKTSGLFPSTYNFQSLASICAYYKTFSVDEESVESSEEKDEMTQDQRLRAAWKSILELMYVKKQQTSVLSPKAQKTQKTQVQFELFDVDKFFDTIKRLSKKPASVHVSVKHFYSTLNALNVVEALTKLYERIVLGIDYGKPRTGADGFIYGIRLGRKATVHPAMAMAASAAAASAAVNTDGEMHPVGSPPVLDLRRYRPAEVSFRTRVQTFSKFWQTLKKVIEFVRENVDDVSAELAGNMKGTGDDCVLNGSFKDADFRGPLSMGLAVPPCFLGFYRAEMIALGNNRVGMQVDAMLPSVNAKTVTGDQSVKPLQPVGRVMLADLSTEVLVDVDALVARELERREEAAKRKVTGSLNESGTNSTHCALNFSFGPAFTEEVDGKRSLGQLNVSTSDFTKLHTTAKAGSIMVRLLSIADYFLTNYVRPQLLRAFPQHQVLFDTAKASIMALLQSPKLEVDFDIMARAFIHEDESLMVTLCGSPLHPTPMTFKDEVKLMDIILRSMTW